MIIFSVLKAHFSLGYKGLYFTAWGSVGFDKEDTKEIDLTLGYEVNGFSVSVTDYWTDEEAGFFHYGARNTAHVFEAQLGYDFGWLAANWYTNFAGADGVTLSGKRAYSSYFELSAPFALGGIDWEVRAGAVPWATDYYNDGTGGFEVAEVAVTASREIPITGQYALPLSASLAWNPATEGAYFVFGIHF